MRSLMPQQVARPFGAGAVEQPWPDVRRIAILRGGGLGDLLFTMPAMQALAAAYPDAELLLLGTPLHAALLQSRPTPVHRVLTLPPAQGVHEPAGVPPDESAQEAFFHEATQQPVDLGVQVHGGGRWSNPFLQQLNPHWTVGARTPDATALTRCVPFRYYQHEVLRALEIVGLAGAPPVMLEPQIPVTQADRDTAEQVLQGLPESLVTIHPGASDPRRRWSPERFAEVGAKQVEQGAGVVVVGAPEEAELIDEVASLIRQRVPAGSAGAVRELSELDIATLCGVLAGSHVLIGNDSGPRHLASAVGTATVSVYWMGNVINAGPLSRSRDRVLISWTTSCPVCGVDCTREDLPRCEHNVSFVDSVSAGAVAAEVDDLLAEP